MNPALLCIASWLSGAVLQTLQFCPRSWCPDILRSWRSCHRWMTTPIPYPRTQTSPQGSNPQTTTYQVRLGQTGDWTDGLHHPATSSSRIQPKPLEWCKTIPLFIMRIPSASKFCNANKGITFALYTYANKALICLCCLSGKAMQLLRWMFVLVYELFRDHIMGPKEALDYS